MREKRRTPIHGQCGQSEIERKLIVECVYVCVRMLFKQLLELENFKSGEYYDGITVHVHVHISCVQHSHTHIHALTRMLANTDNSDGTTIVNQKNIYGTSVMCPFMVLPLVCTFGRRKHSSVVCNEKSRCSMVVAAAVVVVVTAPN